VTEGSGGSRSEREGASVGPQALPDDEARAAAVRRMLEARSVAIVGASVREGSVGNQSLVELRKGGFEGRVFPVNPKYGEILGWRCYPSLSELGEPVDIAILAVSNALLEDQMRAAAEAGAGSAVIFASGYEAPRDGVPPLTERLASIASGAGMALCGGNGMGFANVAAGLRALGFYEPEDLVPGGLVFVSHSGSAFSAMLHNDRGLRFDLAVSAGQELVTTAADYVAYALDREETRAIGLFIETVRDPARFVRALERARERDVPVLALKVGREALTRRMISAHSGALAGEDGAYEALFEAHGVLRVENLDEMADALALFASGRRAGPGGLASVHDSGGERALLVDAAASIGLPLARVSDETSARMEALLEPGLMPVNPLDFWGTGRDAREVITGCMRILLEDPDTAALAFSVDLTTEDNPDMGYIGMAREVFPATGKPFAMLSSFSSGIDRADVRELDEAGIPVLEGTSTGLAAFRHLFDYRDHRALPPVTGSPPASAAEREGWRRRLASAEPFDEVEGFELLSAYGVPAVAARRVTSVAEAAAAAEGRWPVTLKTAAPGVPHKSEVDGVRLGLRDEAELRAAYAELEGRLGPRMTVAQMAGPGIEMHLGIVRDEQFGPLVLVAAGGVLIEVLGDRRMGMPPLDEARATRMIDRLRARPLLDGVRGRPAADVVSLSRALAGLSWLAADLGDRLEALDVNPVICGPNGCVAVDALVVPRAGRA
jgi:acyl-CoA synthetase (NDP forming)